MIKEIENNKEMFVEWRRQLHMNPELSYQEHETAKPYGTNPQQAANKKKKQGTQKIKNRLEKGRKEPIEAYVNDDGNNEAS